MKFLNLDDEEVLKAGKENYPNCYIDLDHTAFYVRDIAKGTIHIDGMDQSFYVSTNYVYEDHMINGNDTRFKCKLTTITLKENEYEVIYDSYGKTLVAYMEDEMKFIPYEDFYDMIKALIHVEEEKKEA